MFEIDAKEGAEKFVLIIYAVYELLQNPGGVGNIYPPAPRGSREET